MGGGISRASTGWSVLTNMPVGNQRARGHMHDSLFSFFSGVRTCISQTWAGRDRWGPSQPDARSCRSRAPGSRRRHHALSLCPPTLATRLHARRRRLPPPCQPSSRRPAPFPLCRPQRQRPSARRPQRRRPSVRRLQCRQLSARWQRRGSACLERARWFRLLRWCRHPRSLAAAPLQPGMVCSTGLWHRHWRCRRLRRRSQCPGCLLLPAWRPHHGRRRPWLPGHHA